ncbi:MAG: DUF6110 family protein [Lachnospiraceae bacterium]|nr:DUF6110 family protein [Lachnospiraceae bacterium]
MSAWSKAGLFVGGVLFGTAGVKILGSKDAKKAYTHTVAAALRAKESVMTTATTIRENADDILADAKVINEKRAAEVCEEDIPDSSDEADAVGGVNPEAEAEAL